MSDLYHYTECGLDNVYLENGFVLEDSSYGETLAIHNVEGLHHAISCSLTSRPLKSGREFRFLRHELDLSQKALSGLMGNTEQTIANWEKGSTEINLLADSALRTLYQEKHGENPLFTEKMEEFSKLDSEHLRLEEQLKFLEDDATGWKAA